MTRTHRLARLRRAATDALAAPVLLLALSASAFAAQTPGQDEQPPAPPPSENRRATDDDRQLIRALGLTPQQRAEIARIRRETQGQNRAIGQRIRRSRRALEEAIYSPSVDERAVDELSREVAAGESERVRLRAQTELRIRRLLTPEQLDFFRELRRRAAQRGRRNLPPGGVVRGGVGVGGRAPGSLDLAERRRERQLGQSLPAPRPDDAEATPKLTPRERRRAARERRGAPPRRPLP